MRSSRLLVPALLALFLVGVAAMLLVGESSLFRSHALHRELDATLRRVAEVERANTLLRARLRRLRDDPAAVERVAAGELGLAAPGSTIYRFDGP